MVYFRIFRSRWFRIEKLRYFQAEKKVHNDQRKIELIRQKGI